jgi:hypothetical protein
MRMARATALATDPAGTPGMRRCPSSSVRLPLRRARSPKRVATGPGLTVLTTTPRPATSRRRPSLNPCTANLVAA